MVFHLATAGEPLPGYRLVGPVGRGSFGEVWKADRPGGGHVALKFIPLTSSAADIEQRALESLTAIRHPNLLVLFGSWRIEPYLVIGMELADKTLHARFEEARAAGLPGVPPEELVELLEGAARGLDYLNAHRHPHPQGGARPVAFQHRDVKPSNLFLVGDGVKVGDWGLIRMLEGEAANHTGHLTPNFAAPEFFRGQTSSRSDQYCLAVTAYFLRTGHLPFSGDPCGGHLHRPPELGHVRGRQERAVLARALAKAPADRWPSCRAFVEALRSAVRAGAQPPPLEPSTVPGGPTVPHRVGLTVPRFHYGSVVPPRFFIGREAELSEGQALVRACQSFLLTGEHRAGKTSFCKKLIHELMARPDNQTLAAYLNLQQLLNLTVDSFLEHTLLNVMGEIARQVFGCKYADLMRPHPAAGHPHLQDDPVFESFVHVFQLVLSRTQRGPAAGPAPLGAQEFVQFTQDLLDIVRPAGWKTFVIFYDEANRLPRELSVDLLVSNEEALNAAGVVSVYVASPVMAQAFRPVYESFGRELRVGRFPRVEDLHRLLARYYYDDEARVGDLPVTPAALAALWSATRGKPFLIQLVAGRSFEHACAGEAAVVDACDVEAGAQALRAERPEWFADD